MSYEITISGSGKYLRVRIVGEMTRKLAQQIAVDATGRSIEHGVERFLYDVRDAPNVETILSSLAERHEPLTPPRGSPSSAPCARRWSA